MDEYILEAEAIGKSVKSLMEECAAMAVGSVAYVFKLGQASKSPLIWESKDRRAVRILCTDKPGPHPIAGYFIDSMYKTIFHWTAEGVFVSGGAYGSDLIIPEGFNVGAPDKTEAGEVK